MFDWQDNNGRPLADPLALLEAVRRHADRTAVFCQAGEIKVPRRDHLLLGYLEGSIVEVTARERGGVFHPKLWVLRFLGPSKAVLYRLICLSRNLTFDRSWDTMLVVEGELVDRQKAFASNHPLADFVSALPTLAVRDVPARVSEIVDLFQNELRRVRFAPPEGYEELAFWSFGLTNNEAWPFEDSDRALVISPFLSDGLLSRVVAKGKEHVLVSRLESLQALKTKTREQFRSLHVLREGTEGETDEGEAVGGEFSLSGLHAKVYVVDNGWNARVFCGSANATDSAFTRNVEFLVELRGKKSKYGVEATLAIRDGDTSLSSLLEEVKISESTPGDSVREELERLLGETRRRVWEARIRLEVQEEGENGFRLFVRQAKPLRLPDGATLRCWPITLREESAQDLVPQAELAFGPLSFEALTSFLAFEATVSASGQTERCRFVLNLPLIGAPPDRKERLLRSLLRDPEQVLRLLLLLLSEGGLDAGVLLGKPQGESGGTAWGAYGQSHLFESLMRALDRAPHKLDDVAAFFADLSRSEQTRGLLPEGFDAIWGPIWEARQSRRPKESREET